MKINIKLLSSILSIILSVFLIIKNSITFNPIRFTCNNYIFNSYLYLFLCLAIVSSIIFSYDHFNTDVMNIFSGIKGFTMMILSLFLIFAIFSVNPKQFLLKHILFITFLIFVGTLLYPLYLQNKHVFFQSGLTTLIILLSLSIIAFYFKDYIKTEWKHYLFFGLLILIISIITEMILKHFKVIKTEGWKRVISYVTILLFSGFILYDTKNIIRNSKTCVNADYITQSLDIFIDSLNIFNSINYINA